MTEDEEKVLIDLYRKKFSLCTISKKFVRRSSNWVENQYLRLYKKNLRFLKQFLCKNLTNDEIGTQIKDGYISEKNFKHQIYEKEELIESLNFIKDDRNGQIMYKCEHNSQRRRTKRANENA